MKMKIFLMLAIAVSVSSIPALAQKSTTQAQPLDCARESQQAVARRHRLLDAGSNSLSLKIYADPKLAQEADDAFDACVRRQR